MKGSTMKSICHLGAAAEAIPSYSLRVSDSSFKPSYLKGVEHELRKKVSLFRWAAKSTTNDRGKKNTLNVKEE